jgi:hypothetical protein
LPPCPQRHIQKANIFALSYGKQPRSSLNSVPMFRSLVENGTD